MQPSLPLALTVTTLAGLSTMLGAALSVLVPRPGARTLAASSGFAAGVMVFVSFAGFLYHSAEAVGELTAFACFLAGMTGMFLLDVVIPHDYLSEKHQAHGHGRVMRAGMLAALGITIHNIPEGMAVFTGMLHDTGGLGWAVAVAIALHNIPEGLAVAAPVYAATGSRGRALGWSLVASLAEPAGALLAAVVLWPILSDTVMAGTLAVVAGVMVFISLDELLPAAKSDGAGHAGIVGVIGGMAVMAAGLLMLHVASPHRHGEEAGGGHQGGAGRTITAPELPGEHSNGDGHGHHHD